MDDSKNPLSISRLGDRIIVGIQGDISGPNLNALQTDILEQLTTSNIKQIIFDISAVELIDIHEFKSFLNVVKMVELMGIVPIVIGLNPGVAAFLADANINTTSLITALGLDDIERVIANRLRDSNK